MYLPAKVNVIQVMLKVARVHVIPAAQDQLIHATSANFEAFENRKNYKLPLQELLIESKCKFYVFKRTKYNSE